MSPGMNWGRASRQSRASASRGEYSPADFDASTAKKKGKPKKSRSKVQRPRRTTANEEISRRKELIAGLRNAEYTSKAELYAKASKEFDLLDAVALGRLGRQTDVERGRLTRAQSEWRKRLNEVK